MIGCSAFSGGLKPLNIKALISISQPLVYVKDLDSIAFARSSWEDRSFCCLRAASFPESHLYVIGHWICGPWRPLIASILFVFTFAVNFYDIYNSCPSNTAIFSISGAFAIVSICVITSYVKTIVTGPGYLPFNYSKSQIGNPSWEESMSLLATTDDQILFAKHSPHPSRSIFSTSARRFVLRADHLCVWVNSWVGLRNTRQFALLTFWSAIYSLSWLGSHYWWALKAIKAFHYIQIITYFSILPILATLSITSVHFLKIIRNISSNVTGVERFQHGDLSVYNKGLEANCSEVCGNVKYCALWPLPCFDFAPSVDGLYGFDGFL